MAFSSALDGATEDCHDCDAAGSGCVGRCELPSQAGLVKGFAVAITLASWGLDSPNDARFTRDSVVCASIRRELLSLVTID